MATLGQFNEEQIKNIESYFYIDCEMIHDESVSLKKKMMICPVHKTKHERLPDADTFKMLIEMYPNYTMQAWGDVFKTTREAVRVLYAKAFNGANMGRDRLISLYGEEPNMEIIKEYTDLIANKPAIPLKSIGQFVDVSENYIQYWKIRNQEVSDMFDNAIKKREYRKDNPEQLKCYRCKLILPVEDFHKSEKSRHGYSRTCKECSIAQVSAYYEKRREEFDPQNIASEKKCSTCKVIKHRRDFHIARGMSGGLQSNCIQCMDAMQKSNAGRKQKFKDFGLDVNKDCKSEDCSSKDYWDFYLIRPNPSHRPFVSDYCRACVKKYAKQTGQPTSFVTRYRGECGRNRENQPSPKEFFNQNQVFVRRSLRELAEQYFVNGEMK
jgi:hypothetical protein